MSENPFWPQLREALAGNFPAEARPWLALIHGAQNGTDGRVRLVVATSTAQDWIGREYGERILATARQLGHEASSLEFRVLQLEAPPAGAQAPRIEAPAESPAAGTKEQWSRVPLSILCDPQLSANAKLVWIALVSWAGCDVTSPKVATIGARCGLSMRSVRRGLSELEAGGYLAVEGGRDRRGGQRKPNVYTLLTGRERGQIGRVSAVNPANLPLNPAKSAEIPGQFGRHNR